MDSTENTTKQRRQRRPAVERIAALRAKREQLAARLKRIDAAIAALEQKAHKRELNEVMQLLREGKITLEQLRQLVQ